MSVVGSGIGQPKRANQPTAAHTTPLARLENVLAPAGRYPAPPTNQLAPKECDGSMASNPTRTRASPAAASQSSIPPTPVEPVSRWLAGSRFSGGLLALLLPSVQSANCAARSEHLFLCLLHPERARRGGMITVPLWWDGNSPTNHPSSVPYLVGHFIRRRPSPNASFGGVSPSHPTTATPPTHAAHTPGSDGDHSTQHPHPSRLVCPVSP